MMTKILKIIDIFQKIYN